MTTSIGGQDYHNNHSSLERDECEPSIGRTRRRRRAALGCYTCRYRKVRCAETAPSPSSHSESTTTKCGNCERLAFECRWQSPEPGERFVPPPKRRRTTAGDHLSSAGEREGSQTAPSQYAVSQPVSQAPPESSPLSILGGGIDLVDAVGNLGAIPGLDLITPMVFDFGPLDLLSEPMNPDPLVLHQGAPVNAPSWMDHTPLSIDAENRHLIQHYLETMKSFAKVEDQTPDSNNLYVSAFTRALYLPALFRAILAYSASHLGLSDSSFLPGAELHAQAATEALKDSVANDLEAGTADIEGLLSAAYILLKREHLVCGAGSLTRVHALLDLVGNVIASPGGIVAIGEPGGFARRITLRLAYVDCRAALFRLGHGRLVSRLKGISTLEDVFDETATSHRRLIASAGSAGSAQGINGSVTLLRANLFRLKAADIDRRLYASQSPTADVINDRGVRREEILQLKHEIEDAIQQIDFHDENQGDPSAAHYNRWLVTASYHSVLLYLNHLWTLPSFEPNHSVLRILTLQLAARSDPIRRNTPSSVWPVSLFMAGIGTSDPVYRAWICDHLERCEQWGNNIRLARQLLLAVTERSTSLCAVGTGGRRGGYVDIREVMEATTGEFVF